MEAGGGPLRWGRDTVRAGTAAPYLQPAYPRFPRPPDEAPEERWEYQEPLGRWRVYRRPAAGLVARATS